MLPSREPRRTAVVTRRGARSIALVLVLLASGLGACSRGPGREPDAVGGPALLRRLTESQYRATVADIFGPDIRIAARFEPGLRDEGLIAVGTSRAGMSPFSIEQYQNAALSVSADVLSDAHRSQTVPCRPRPDARHFDAACAAQFFARYGELLLRRPPSAQDKQRFMDWARLGTDRLNDFYGGLQFALAGTMMSPEFLLRVEKAVPDPSHPGKLELDAWSKAVRLSYFLTNSTPDRELLRAAGAGELDTKDGLTRQVDRLMAGPRFEAAVRTFFADMLQFDKFDDLDKDPIIYPAFNTTVAADAQEQTLKTIVDLLIAQHGDYRDLFTTRHTYLTRALGVVYGVPVATRNGWESGDFPADSHRAGIQSHISFLALYAHPGRSSATLRGKAIREVFLCEEVPDAPANVNFAVIQDTSNKKMPTARDRLTAHRTEPSCAGCHKVMDPVGLTLENFDGVGTYRDTENDARINPSGEFDGMAVDSPEELGQALHDHPETPKCLVERMYRFAVGRDTEFEERPYMDYLDKAFEASGYRVPDLMRTIALSNNFYAISAPGSLQDEYERAAWQTPRTEKGRRA